MVVVGVFKVCCLLEIKRTSITRLKPADGQAPAAADVVLKSKEPRLRDWNMKSDISPAVTGNAWNQKNLDYEIETLHATAYPQRVISLKSKEPRLRDWNLCVPSWYLKKRQILKSKEPRLRDWNGLVNYLGEVCVLVCLKSKEPRLRDWNGNSNAQVGSDIDLKSKEPRLRDWNAGNKKLAAVIRVKDLKSKEPRLRDWNDSDTYTLVVSPPSLEIKRTSITRLKLYNRHPSKIRQLNLKSKEPRLRDWNFSK